MNDTEFIEALAETIEQAHLIVLADDDGTVISWGFPCDQITVTTDDGDRFVLSVCREEA